ncbi:MAG: SdpI family protein [Actinomycetales bacterium]|nr:SdpI family protein [Actinomycetales bacterium]
MNSPWFTAFLMLAVDIVLVVIMRMAALGRLKRNSWAGIRLPATISSDAAWVLAHKTALPYIWVTASVNAVLSVTVLLTGAPANLMTLVLTSLALIVLVSGLIYGSSRGVRAARALGTPSKK